MEGNEWQGAWCVCAGGERGGSAHHIFILEEVPYHYIPIPEPFVSVVAVVGHPPKVSHQGRAGR